MSLLNRLNATNENTVYVIYNIHSQKEIGVTDSKSEAEKAVSNNYDYSTYPPYTYAPHKNMGHVELWSDSNCDI